MDESPEPEPQRFLGMRIAPGQSLPRVDPTAQRVLGIPLSWYSATSIDLSALRHPIRWTKERANRHRS